MTTRVLSRTAKSPSFYFKWIIANALAELVGLGTVALLVMLLTPRLESGLTFGIALMLFASVSVEGLCVGAAQWWVLREQLSLKAFPWIGMTVLGGTVAWLIGMIAGSTLSFEAETTAVTEPGLIMTLLLSGLMGLGLGVMLGTAQWLVLKNYVKRAVWWIPANAVAWLVGMVIIFASIDFLMLLSSPLLIALSSGLALLLTGAGVGAIHGGVLDRLLHASAASANPSPKKEDVRVFKRH
jgi:hypothetical protein